MKPVPAHTLRVKAFRNGEMIGERAMPAMKCGIEAGNLRDVRKLSKDRADGRKIVRLVRLLGQAPSAVNVCATASGTRTLGMPRTRFDRF